MSCRISSVKIIDSNGLYFLKGLMFFIGPFCFVKVVYLLLRSSDFYENDMENRNMVTLYDGYILCDMRQKNTLCCKKTQKSLVFFFISFYNG